MKQVDLSSTKPFRIAFQVDSYTPNTYLAIDDISYRLGTCSGAPPTPPAPPTQPPIGPALSMDCNFESSSYCNWKSTLTGTNYWRIGIGSSRDSPILPGADHTRQNAFGHYLYLYHNGNDFVTTKRASLSVVNNVPISGTPTPFCLTLWYYMKGQGTFSFNLTVTAPDNTIKGISSRNNGQGEKWNMLQIEAPGDKSGYTYMISASAHYGKFLRNYHDKIYYNISISKYRFRCDR